MKETGLVKYDAMCQAIAECHSVDEVVEIRHKARAFEVYAKQAMNIEAEKKAVEIRIRAERKAGKLLKEMKKDGRRAGKGKPSKIISSSTILNGNSKPAVLPDLGITPDQSSTWQNLAEVPQEDFEIALAAPGKTTTGRILTAAGKTTKAPVVPKIHLDLPSLWAYSRVMDFEKIMERPAGELFALMQDFQQEKIVVFLPKFIQWLKEMK